MKVCSAEKNDTINVDKTRSHDFWRYINLCVSMYKIIQYFTSYHPVGGETICPPSDGCSTRGGSTSVRERVRSPHMAKL